MSGPANVAIARSTPEAALVNDTAACLTASTALSCFPASSPVTSSPASVTAFSASSNVSIAFFCTVVALSISLTSLLAALPISTQTEFKEHTSLPCGSIEQTPSCQASDNALASSNTFSAFAFAGSALVVASSAISFTILIRLALASQKCISKRLLLCGPPHISLLSPSQGKLHSP